MGKRRFTEVSWHTDPWFKGLSSAIASCKGEAEVAALLRDIGTLSELQAWSERLEVAKQLSQGLSYRQVAANTGASTTTVTRVAKFIENGEGGYLRFLRRKKHKIVDDIKQNTVAPSGIQKASVLRKYLQETSG
ncbi:MAG: hypothetical protein K9M03_00785 [Kiritimatiellales bacterium]|nr:hypothetical protein [Kiritimatiellales bacterium]